MRTPKLTLEYDGTRYSGWQEQTNARTIAGELHKAAEDFFGRAIELGGAGRTDAGVHAIAQVAHLKLPRRDASPAHTCECVQAPMVKPQPKSTKVDGWDV